MQLILRVELQASKYHFVSVLACNLLTNTRLTVNSNCQVSTSVYMFEDYI
jgi:hypothetical protein